MREALQFLRFGIENLASQVVALGEDRVRSESDKEIRVRSYVGGHETQIVLWWTADLKCLRFVVQILGEVVDWNHIIGVRTGCVIDVEVGKVEFSQIMGSADAPYSNDVQSVVHYDTTVNSSTLERVAKLVELAEQLAPQDRAAIQQGLKPQKDAPTSQSFWAQLIPWHRR